MEPFWEAFAGWTPFGQGVFILLVLGGLTAAIRYAIWSFLVLLRGWPPEHIKHPNEED